MIESELETSERHPGAAVKRSHQTDSGLPLKEFSSQDWQGERTDSGDYPYVRGTRPGVFRDELWHRDIYSGFGNAEDSQGRYKDLLETGASGLNMAFDLPTQLGFDSDDPEARFEVGKVGIALDTLADVLDLIEGISLKDAGTIFTVGNGIGPIALSWFMLAGERQGLSTDDYTIHLQNDPLKEFTGRGAFVFPVEPHFRLSCDVIEYLARLGALHWKPVGICGSQYRWGGGTAVHELAFALSTARAYVEELLNRGLDIDDFAPLLELHLTVDTDPLEEAAKFRAARLLWATMMQEDYGAKLPESKKLRISLYTAGYRLTAQEPLNNSVRITLQALGAVLGGVDHIGTLAIDEAMATPSAEAARLSVQTQNILAYETSIPSVPDPLGGSWYIESLTDRFAEAAASKEREILDRGGMVKSLKDGYIQGLLHEMAYEFQKKIEDGNRVVVGLNAFMLDQPSSSLEPFRIDDEVTQRQIQRLQRIRSERDEAAVTKALDELTEQARGTVNLVEPIKAACAAYASIGEICSRLRQVFGSWEDDGIFL